MTEESLTTNHEFLSVRGIPEEFKDYYFPGLIENLLAEDIIDSKSPSPKRTAAVKALYKAAYDMATLGARINYVSSEGTIVGTPLRILPAVNSQALIDFGVIRNQETIDQIKAREHANKVNGQPPVAESNLALKILSGVEKNRFAPRIKEGTLTKIAPIEDKDFPGIRFNLYHVGKVKTETLPPVLWIEETYTITLPEDPTAEIDVVNQLVLGFTQVQEGENHSQRLEVFHLAKTFKPFTRIRDKIRDSTQRIPETDTDFKIKPSAVNFIAKIKSQSSTEPNETHLAVNDEIGSLLVLLKKTYGSAQTI